MSVARNAVGPVGPPAHAVVQPVPGCTLNARGLLGRWQERNRRATIDHCAAQLHNAGNLDNLRRLTGESDAPYRGFPFADSDIYKVLEAIAWESGRSGDAAWSGFVADTIALLEAAQDADGYLNSHVQDATARWTDLDEGHELYCAGHLIQAAVALDRAVGDDALLAVARRFADHIVDVFTRNDGVDGHPLIETALVELFRHTRDDRYLTLAARMVELRGRGLLHGRRFGAQWLQDHAPVRDATEAIGHAVRQLYLAAGVTDVYLETGDGSLLDAMERLWHSAYTQKVFVTGGHGSRHRDEAYGDPYELPPDRAYAETCAAIAAFMWNWRLLLSTGHGRYAEEMERALYSAISVSVAEDGRHFFYANPLHVREGHDGSNADSPSERLPWYACACCPPNLARLFASLQHYLATRDDDGLQIHLLTAATVQADGVTVTLDTRYPWDGRVKITVDGPAREWTLGLRIPEWCAVAWAEIDGTPVDARPDERGYLRLRRNWGGVTRIVLDVPMPVRVIRAHPRVDAVRGCVVLTRGPLVYCVEQADHDVAVEDLRVDPAAPPQPVERDGLVTLAGDAAALTHRPATLYTSDEADTATPAALTAIPYFAWGNRGPNAMRVWIPTA